MRKLALILFFSFFLTPTWAQIGFFGSAGRLSGGSGAPSAGACASAGDVGKVYVRKDAAATNSSLYVCSNTSVGTYQWEIPTAGACPNCLTTNGEPFLIDNGVAPGANATAGKHYEWFDTIFNTRDSAGNFSNTVIPKLRTSHKFITNVGGDGTQNEALVAADDLTGLFCSDAGASDAYACTLSPAITAYTTGVHYRFKANTANTGAATINFNALGAKTIKKVAGGITTDLADNDIRAGQWVDVVYDGTNMQMQSTLGNAGGGAGTVTATGTLTADQPVFGNGGTDTKIGTKTGNTNNVATADAGAKTSGNFAKWDANGNLTDGGAGTAGAVASSDLSELQVTITNSTTLSFSGGNFNVGGNTFYTMPTGTPVISGVGTNGTYTAKVSISEAGVWVIRHPSAAGLTFSSCTNCVANQETTPTLEDTDLYIADVTITVTGGTAAFTAVTDKRSVLRNFPVVAGSYITASKAGGIVSIAVDKPALEAADFTPTGTWNFSGAASVTLPANPRIGAIGFNFDGGGSAITTGMKGCVVAEYAGTITQATLLATDGNTGSIVVDVWKDTYANHPPTVADTITAAAKPTISSGVKAQDATLTGWTKSFSAGDIFCFNVDSASVITRATLSLKTQRSN